jgi:biopolymer transport protein ExbB
MTPQPKRSHLFPLAALLVLAAAAPEVAHAQAPPAAAAAEPPAVKQNFTYFLFGGGGLIGIACTVPILLMSVAAVALAIEQIITVRRSVLMPPGLGAELHSLIANGSFAHAEQQCRLKPSFLSRVALAGLQEVRLGYTAVEKAMEDASQGEASRLSRKIELLSVLANISTMLGLFGTVVGLVIAFKQVADTQGVARASDLAGGIYLALMTTVEGLMVAIPSVGAYALFRHRADQLAAETALMAEYAFTGYKRERAARRTTEPPRPSRSPAGG